MLLFCIVFWSNNFSLGNLFQKHLKNLTDPKVFCIHMYVHILTCEFLVFSCSSDRNKASLHSATAQNITIVLCFCGPFIPEIMLSYLQWGNLIQPYPEENTNKSGGNNCVYACAWVSFKTWRFSNPSSSSCLTVSFHFLSCKLSTNTNRG